MSKPPVADERPELYADLVALYAAVTRIGTTFEWDPFVKEMLDASVGLANADSGALLCTWAEVSDQVVGAYGRQMSQDGNPLSAMRIYDTANRDSFPCPPALTTLRTSNGGAIHMIYHS